MMISRASMRELMNKKLLGYLIIDFDSTFVNSEALEVVAEEALRNNPRKDLVFKKIKRITSLGMEGKINFSESLNSRLSMFSANNEHIKAAQARISNTITPSLIENRCFFRENADNIYIISGGFREFIEPVAEIFRIPANNILANRFCFDGSGKVKGADRESNLCQSDGKCREVARLGLKGPLCVIGDGYTDYQVKENGSADKFIAFTENIQRPEVVEKADWEAKNFHQVLAYLEKIKMIESIDNN